MVRALAIHFFRFEAKLSFEWSALLYPTFFWRPTFPVLSFAMIPDRIVQLRISMKFFLEHILLMLSISLVLLLVEIFL